MLSPMVPRTSLPPAPSGDDSPVCKTKYPSAQTCLAAARKDFWNWTKEWGSIDFFEFHIQESYQVAIDRRGAVSAWASKIRIKLQKGRKIVEKIREIMTLDLPSDHSEVEDIWRQAFDMMSQLHRGLALLEAWLDVTKAM
jgi:hypothetical protein